MHPRRPNPDESLPGWLTDLQDELGAEVCTTHISWLLLTDDRAYKLKRPLHLPFLDYSTHQARLQCCHQELHLNRRFAADLYLDVVELGATREPAVVMRRFDEAMRADHLVESGEFTPAQVGELVDGVLGLHREAPAAEPGSPLGSPESVRRWSDGTMARLAEQLGDDAQLHHLSTWMAASFARLDALMTHRQATGWVREGHGDLHLQNVVVYQGRVTPYDCIEFNPELRWLDIANEFSFAYFDLLEHHRPDLAAVLVNHWFTAHADVDGLALLPLYSVKGALVRAMVAGDEGDDASRGGYLDLAASMANLPQPRLTITHGVSGSGKSTQAQALALADPSARTVWLRSDVERKRLHGLAATEPSDSTVDGGIYTATDTDATYQRLADLATALLAAGWSVVVDAAFLQRWQRDRLRAVADAARVGFSILVCEAEPDELRERIRRRRGDASEATVAVLEQQLADYVPLGADELVLRAAPVAVAATPG